MATKYTNLPGVFLDVLDGQLTAIPSPGDPKFLILGTTNTTTEDSVAITYPYTVSSTSDAVTLFGSPTSSAFGGISKAILESGQAGATTFQVWSIGTITSGKRSQYEELFKAYDAMYDQNIDMVIPYGVYLDDFNVMDMTVAECQALNDSGAFKATGAQQTVVIADTADLLGRVYAKKVNGTWKFAWWFPDDPTDLAGSIFSSATADLATFGTSRLLGDISGADNIADGSSKDDYHEVNFAYQLADFCHRGSSIIDMRLGFIGVNPPTDFISLTVQSNWVGTAPIANSSGVVTTNGDGLLGNKFMGGRKEVGNTFADFRAAAEGGGFFASAESSDAKRGFTNGAVLLELEDANGFKQDIGKYISVIASWATVGTGAGWEASAAATYAAFVSTLPVQSAPTNKSLQGSAAVLGTVAAPSFDDLAGHRYIGLLNKATRSAVITDSPTAALITSDYRRLSTMRQVEECVDGIRFVSEPFLGEGMTAAETAALDTAIGSKLKAITDRGAISGYDYQVIMTPEQKVLGQATVQLKIIPAFELRQITVVVGLSAS